MKSLSELLDKKSPAMKSLFVKTINLHAGHKVKDQSASDVQKTIIAAIENIAEENRKEK